MRWTKVVALAAAGTLSLAACGGGSPSDNNKSNSSSGGAGSSTSSAPADAALDPNAKGPAPEISGAKKGGNLTISYSNVPETLSLIHI